MVTQDMQQFNPLASLGVAVREYPTSTGLVDTKNLGEQAEKEF